MSVYLDAGVLLAALAEEANTAAVDGFLSTAVTPLLVSDLAAAEVASALAGRVGALELSAPAARAILADFDSWRSADTEAIDLEAGDARAAGELARRLELGLQPAQALHLAICLRTGASLMTFDRGLAAAALALDLPVVGLTATGL